MEKFKKVLVGLDLTQMDEILIQRTNNLVKLFGIETVYFVHVTKDQPLSEDIAKTYPNLSADSEGIKNGITAAINQIGAPEGAVFEVEVKDGHPTEVFLQLAKEKDIDLIIVGRKVEKKGSGSLSKVIAQKSPCSVLFITEYMENKYPDNIMVPIDFSSYSALSLNLVQNIIQDTNKIKCYHIYEIPSGYTKTGKTFSEFADIMLENSKKDYQRFIQKHGFPEFECTFMRKTDRNRAKILMTAAKNEGVDFIVIGSRGRTNSASLLIGSVAEKIISRNKRIPMLILKKKGENMRFLEALFRI